MNVFFKKYWPNVLLALISGILVFFIIPYQEKAYLSGEVKEIKTKTGIILRWSELILGLILVVYLSIKLRRLQESIIALVNVFFFAVVSYFFLAYVFLSAAMFLNGLAGDKMIVKEYTVGIVDKPTGLLVINKTGTLKGIMASELLRNYDGKDLEPLDTITVSFRKGLLGFEFDPKIIHR